MNTITGIVYGLSNDEYRKSKGINCSGLKRILQSPLHYKSSLEQPREETKALMIGSAVHAAILEPTAFAADYIAAPESIDRRTKDGKAAWAALEASGKNILGADDYRTVIDMQAAIAAHPTASKLLSNGMAEVSVFCEIDGIAAKARFDYLRHGVIVDLKTTDDASPEAFARSVAKYAYDMQAAWYLDCAEAVGLDVSENFIFVAIEKAPPYGVGIYQLDGESLRVGRAKCRKALSMYKYCKENNEWFGYSPDVITISLPRWAMNAEAA